MNLLTALGWASLLFVVAFTIVQATRAATAGQSPRDSIVEAWTNILVGFSINYAVNLLLIPLAAPGGHLTAASNWWMGWCFTTVSIVRQYVIRRWFNRRQHRPSP
jgi:hypothetical protein